MSKALPLWANKSQKQTAPVNQSFPQVLTLWATAFRSLPLMVQCCNLVPVGELVPSLYHSLQPGGPKQ